MIAKDTQLIIAGCAAIFPILAAASCLRSIVRAVRERNGTYIAFGCIGFCIVAYTALSYYFFVGSLYVPFRHPYGPFNYPFFFMLIASLIPIYARRLRPRFEQALEDQKLGKFDCQQSAHQGWNKGEESVLTDPAYSSLSGNIFHQE